MPRSSPRVRSLRTLVAAAVTLGLFVATTPAQPHSGQASPEARPLFERNRAALEAARTARGRISTTWTIKHEGGDADKTDSSIDLAIAAPRSLFLDKDGFRIYATDQTLTIYRPDFKQYLQLPAPEPKDLEARIEELTEGRINSVPFRSLLLPGLSIEELIGESRSMTAVRPGDWNGRPGAWVTGEGTQKDAEPGTPKYTVQTFFDSATGYALFSTFDMTAQEVARAKAYNQQGEGSEDFEAAPLPESAIWEIDSSRIEYGKPIPPEVFTFTPGASDKKVEEFEYQAPELPPQDSLLGLPAPVFEGKNFDDQGIALADYKGKVLVLDFWATWCGPCVAALPHMQKLREQFADQNVQFLGMNHDQPGSGAKVKKFLDKKKVTIAQFDDSSNSAGQAYGVTGIPCVVLIDTQGIVQSIRVGFSPGEGKELGDEIKQLLEGKSLKTDEQFKALREKAAERSDEEPAARFTSRPLKLESTRAEAIIDSGRLASNISPTREFMTVSSVDVAGDGRRQLVLQGMTGGLVLVSPDGLSITRLRLQGLGAMPMGIQCAEPVRFDGQTRWLIAAGLMPGGSISMHDAEGKRLWSFSPKLDGASMSGCSLALGDADGDGKDEVVAFLHAFKSEESGQNMRSGSLLLVLDAQSGDLLSQKDTGEQGSYMALAQQPSEGKGRVILLGTYSELRRYRFDRARAQISESPSK